MSNQIIGRSKEIERLRRIVESDRAELVAVYGRRRIGKTFLVKEFFNGKLISTQPASFEESGVNNSLCFAMSCDVIVEWQYRSRQLG